MRRSSLSVGRARDCFAGGLPERRAEGQAARNDYGASLLFGHTLPERHVALAMTRRGDERRPIEVKLQSEVR